VRAEVLGSIITGDTGSVEGCGETLSQCIMTISNTWGHVIAGAWW
jgi:hypothetical protein